ncbi:hypothetical protein GIB67_016925 [Kingdonia uniflora]|uniref:DNA polymerase III gamma subunit domain-containing protein n=1 Tax=Kingdonia uniflora TaxID=39325 RepID=A0A7J7M3F3_9MAGN|nr:hypothetical protein GIB67_016925 [Kingdonia uniflora]
MATNNNEINEKEGVRTIMKKNMHRSSNSLGGCSENPKHLYQRSSSLSLSAEFEQSFDQNSISLQEKSPSVRRRKGIRTRKVFTFTGRKTITGSTKKAGSKAKLPFQQDSPVNCLKTSLSSKYQPKLFQDISGHEIIIKALSNAVQKEKIAPLYLFHGPSGTGKTSTARIFAMALNCESTSRSKPCWSCRGCSRTLYIMDLCSGSRIAGFERIKTLLQSTTFTKIVSGFKVFIVEECHLLTAEAWEDILNIVERNYGSNMVFVMITEDVNMVPKAISSRCHKFCFPKLKDADIMSKLAIMVAQENIHLESDALKLIISKAEGSMREAENILDQLGLLGSRITSSIVQQIVGLVPHSKLLDLLRTAITSDTIKTVRTTRELIASGVQPQSLVSQLASLVTEILSGAADATSSSAGSSKDMRLLRNGSQLTISQSEKLSHALKVLVETEKQLSSTNDQTTWVIAAILQIASEQFCRTSTGIVLPRDILMPSDDKLDSESRQIQHVNRNKLSDLLHHSKSRKYKFPTNIISEEADISKNDPGTSIRSKSKKIERETNMVNQVSEMEEVWKNLLARIQSKDVKEFLRRQGKLASLTISSVNAIVHLIFKRQEDKLAAQMSEETIGKALKVAFGCPVTVNISLEPKDLETIERSSSSSTTGKEKSCDHFRQQQRASLPEYKSPRTPNVRGRSVRRSISQKSCSIPESNFPSQENGSLSMNKQIPRDKTYIARSTKPKHKWLSLSTIQQGDASVEPYSQDLLFENANTEKGGKKKPKLQKSISKANERQFCQDIATPM